MRSAFKGKSLGLKFAYTSEKPARFTKKKKTHYELTTCPTPNSIQIKYNYTRSDQ
jgi:hypothetical protein